MELLAERYPDHNWNIVNLLRGKQAQQKRLERVVSSLFPVCAWCIRTPIYSRNMQDAEILTNVRKEAGLVNPATESFLELDIYIPSLNLAFEYHVSPLCCRRANYSQEQHHYGYGTGFIPLDRAPARDRLKLELCKAAGITLIAVPFWWDRTNERYRVARTTECILTQSLQFDSNNQKVETGSSPGVVGRRGANPCCRACKVST